MQQLTIETPATFVVRPGPVTVALVGCGGTGGTRRANWRPGLVR